MQPINNGALLCTLSLPCLETASIFVRKRRSIARKKDGRSGLMRGHKVIFTLTSLKPPHKYFNFQDGRSDFNPGPTPLCKWMVT